jgi:iron complex transport system substrate-binding protein
MNQIALRKTMSGLAAFLLLSLACITFVEASSENSSDRSTITIIDSSGRTVKLPYPIESVVALNSNVPEEMIALGASDKISGIDIDAKKKVDLGLYSQLKDVPVIGSYDDPNYELIAQLKPDVVIQWTSWPPLPDEVAQKLEPFGIPVVALDLYRMEIYTSEVELLGKMLGKEEKAREYISFILDQYDAINETLLQIQESDRKTVYFEGVNYYETYGGADYGCGVPGMIRAGGGKDLYSDQKPYYFTANPEDVAKRNPDIIFKGISDPQGYFMENDSILKDLSNNVSGRVELANTNAVKDGHVYAVSFDATAGLRKKFGPLFIAKALYPEKFQDLDPEAFLLKYLEDYLGISPQGHYIYPPL